MLKASEAEKNMQWEADQAAKQSAQAASQLLTTTLAATGAGPCKLRIINLHPDISDADVKTFFEPFGAVDLTQVARDALGRPMGYAYVTFKNATEGANAMAHWNGKQLAGREVTVEQVTMTKAEGVPVTTVGELDEEEGSFKLTSSSRAQLMSRLAGAAGLEVPAAVLPLAPAAAAKPGLSQQQPALALEQGVLGPASPIPTPCLLLKNMFGDADKVEPGWQAELEGDVNDECSKYGPVLHVHVDPASKVSLQRTAVCCEVVVCCVMVCCRWDGAGIV
jgi:RNA-binding protein 39